MKSFNDNWDGIKRNTIKNLNEQFKDGDKSRESDIAALEMMFNTFHGESVEVNEENLNIGTYGFRLDRDGGKFVLYQLSYNRGSVRFPDGRTGTVIGRYATRDEAIAAAKRNAGVKEEVENVEEGVRMMAGAEKMVKDDPIGGSSMVSSLRAAKKSLEGKPTGSVLVVTKEKSPESMSIKVYAPSDFASLTKGLTKKPEAKVGSKGSWSGGEITVVAIKEEVEVAEQFKAGDKVKVPHKGKMVSGKIVRFDDGGTDKARQHGGGYVVDVGEPASVLVPKQKVQKEEVELDEGLFNSSTDNDHIFTKLDEFSKKMKTASTMRGSCSCAYIKNVADSLMNASNQQKEFFRNLIGMLEDLHMDVGRPSKTGNMVIMNRLQNIISELRKYQK